MDNIHDPLCPWTEDVRLSPDTLAMDKKAPSSEVCPSCHFIRAGRADERERIAQAIVAERDSRPVMDTDSPWRALTVAARIARGDDQ